MVNNINENYGNEISLFLGIIFGLTGYSFFDFLGFSRTISIYFGIFVLLVGMGTVKRGIES